MIPAATAMPMASHLPPALLVAEQQQRNRRAWLLQVVLVTGVLALAGLLLGVVLALLAGGGAAAVGVGLGAGLAAAVLFTNLVPGLGEQVALARAGARPSDPGRHPRLHNLTAGLCEQAGLPVPRLYVVDVDAANAFAVGRDPARSAVVVTRGLLEALNRVELEGVVAHELAHVDSHGARLASATVVLGGLPGLLRERGGGLRPAAAALLAPLAARLLRLGAPPRRLLDADQSAAYLTRYPPGLIGALRKVTAAAGPLPGRPGLDHLWLVAPEPPLPGALPTHPPLEERLDALREM
ncbi:MAG TPA: M48 family metalloprotease [Actinomycetota bacterium]|jgi:heat shock protein HtpX